VIAHEWGEVTVGDDTVPTVVRAPGFDGPSRG
jgi:hypothetical protein